MNKHIVTLDNKLESRITNAIIPLEKLPEIANDIKFAIRKSNESVEKMAQDSQSMLERVTEKLANRNDIKITKDTHELKNTTTDIIKDSISDSVRITNNSHVVENVKEIKTNKVHSSIDSNKDKTENVVNTTIKDLWVGTSIGHTIDREKFEHETNSEITYVKSYMVDFDDKAHFPTKNFLNTVPQELEKRQYDWLGIQSGSIEISNLDISGDTVENIENWKSIVHESSKKVFNLALDAIEKHPNVKGVIIEKKEYQGVTQKSVIKMR